MARTQGLGAGPGFGTGVGPWRVVVRAIQSLFGIYNVLHYGAKGNGTTNDRAAAQRAADAAAATGGTLYYPGGRTYKQNSPVTLSSNVRVEAYDATIDISGAGSTDSAFTATGSDGTSKNLTANASAGNTSLTVAAGDEAAFAVDDYVRIRSTRKYDPGYTDTEDGEIGVVLSTSSGTINLRSPLTGANYTTANSANVTKVNMLSNIDFAGGKIVGLTGTTQKGIKFDRVVKARVTDTEVLNCPSAGVWFVSVLDGRIDRVHVRFSNNGSDGYGVNVSGPSQDCYIDRCYFRGCRHSTSITGSTGGIARRIFFNGCHGIDTTSGGDCYDVHAPAEDIHFRNCHSFDSGNCGFQVEAAKVSIENCVVTRSANHGILCGNATAAATELNIVGNVVSTTSGTAMGIRVVNSSLAGGGATTNVVNISGNTLSAVAGRAIYVVSTDTWRYANVGITGNVVNNCADTTNVVQLQKADNCAVCNNVITGVQGAASSIRLDDVKKTTVVANSSQHLANTAGGRTVSITSGIELAIVGNVGNTSNSGIVLDSASTDNTIVGNMMRSTTTAYSATRATRNRFTNNGPFASVATVASAATLTLPVQPDVIQVTGTTTVTAISTDTASREVSLDVTGACQFTDNNGTLNLAGNFTGPGLLCLYCDGTNWRERSRAVL